MAKLYFKYGAMGSSKTAQALMCKFNYEEKGFKVLLMKSNIDKRDTAENGKIIIKSRIGLSAECETFDNTTNLFEFVKQRDFLTPTSVVIVDEVQFLTNAQIEQLKEVSDYVPVLCYGLMTNFKTELFEGSKRLIEIADSIKELKSICRCGRKATVNARFLNGKLVADGDEIMLGGNESYEAICFSCYKKLKQEALNSPQNNN